jgi:hypothetical protein
MSLFLNPTLNIPISFNNSLTLWKLGHVSIDLVNFGSYCRKACNGRQYYPYKRVLYLGAAIALQVATAVKFSRILKISELCLRAILLSFDIREQNIAFKNHSAFNHLPISVFRVFTEIFYKKPSRFIYLLEFIHSFRILIRGNSGFESTQANSVRKPVISNTRFETQQEREILENFGSTDDVFSKFTCPITLSSIRFIVKSPTLNEFYEEAVITKYLNLKPECPCTRRPLKIDQLERCSNEQRLIDERLKFYIALQKK